MLLYLPVPHTHTHIGFHTSTFFVTVGEFMGYLQALNIWRRSFACYILFPSAENWNAKSVTALGHEYHVADL